MTFESIMRSCLFLKKAHNNLYIPPICLQHTSTSPITINKVCVLFIYTQSKIRFTLCLMLQHVHYIHVLFMSLFCLLPFLNYRFERHSYDLNDFPDIGEWPKGSAWNLFIKHVFLK